jgi:hypothetical protein
MKNVLLGACAVAIVAVAASASLALRYKTVAVRGSDSSTGYAYVIDLWTNEATVITRDGMAPVMKYKNGYTGWEEIK